MIAHGTHQSPTAVVAVVLVFWGMSVAGPMARAASFTGLGHRDDTAIQSNGRECIGPLAHNHDFSFENGYCWHVDMLRRVRPSGM
jgi:hypothetical protein